MPLGPPWFDPPTVWSLDGHRIGLREPSTRELVSALLIDDPESPNAAGLHVLLVCCADDGDRDYLLGRILGTVDQAVSLLELEFVADEVVAAFCGGLPRWAVHKVWRRTYGAWMAVDGDLQLSGVDVMTLPPARATAAVLAVWRKWLRGNEQEMARFNRELETPPLRVIHREDEEQGSSADDGGWLEVEGLYAQTRVSKDEAQAGAGSTIIMPGSDTLEQT